MKSLSDCQAGYEQVSTPPFPVNSNTANYKTCFLAVKNEFSDKTTVNSRYSNTHYTTICATNDNRNNLKTQLNYFLDWSKQKTDITNQKITECENLKTENTNLKGEIDAQKASYSAFQGNSGAIISKVTDPSTGLLAGMDCRFLGDGFSKIANFLSFA